MTILDNLQGSMGYWKFIHESTQSINFLYLWQFYIQNEGMDIGKAAQYITSNLSDYLGD